MVVYVVGFVSAWLLFFWLFGRKPWMWMLLFVVACSVPQSARADDAYAFVISGSTAPDSVGSFFGPLSSAFINYYSDQAPNSAPTAYCQLHDFGSYWYGKGQMWHWQTNPDASGFMVPTDPVEWSVKWVKGGQYIDVTLYHGDLARLFFGGVGFLPATTVVGTPINTNLYGRRFILDQNGHVSLVVNSKHYSTDFNGIWLVNVTAPTTQPTTTPTTEPTTEPSGGDTDNPAGPGDGEKHWVTAVDELLRGSSTNGDNVKPGALDYAMSEDGRASTLSGDLDRFKLDSTVGTDATVAADFYSVLVAWGLQEPSFSGANGDLGGTLFGAWTQGRELNGGVVGNAGFLGLIQTCVRCWVAFRNQWSVVVLVMRTFFTGVIVWGFMVSVYRCFCWALSAGTGGAVAALDIEE